MRGSASEAGSTRRGAATWNARLLMMVPAVMAVLLAFPHSTFAQRSPPSHAGADSVSDVLAFEKQVEEAVLRADVAFLDRVCASDFTYTHGDGWTTGGPTLGVDTKSEWLASLPGRYALREVDSQHVEIHGDVAITMGRVRARTVATNAAQRAFSFWYIRVYARRDGQWRYLSHRTVHGPVYDE